MPKILVADDNSNIQKMVGLALRDQGIDVVAVGNGEAAVRKISDVRPDLVLADVFMPVRNGYEVCKYVKEDSALSHIPVILLVGAFDPLDEQEAQRVGADGVLKKPFVPPDPLISMVKSALSRTGVNYPGGGHGHVEPAQPLRGTDLLTPPARPVAAPPPPPPPQPLTDPVPFHEPVAKKPEPLTIDASTQPLAFGNLLETPATQEEESAAYATPVSPKNVPERNWGATEEEEQEAEQEEESSGGWRPMGGGEEFDVPAGREDWREKAFQTLESIKSSSRWHPTKEKSDLGEVVEAPAAAAFPEVAPQPAPPVNGSWGAPASVDQGVDAAALHIAETDSFVTEAAPEPAPVESPFVSEAAPMVENTTVEAAPAPAQSSPESASWFSVPSNPWDTEAQKATQLASTWDAAPSAAAPQTWPAVPPTLEESAEPELPESNYIVTPDPELVLDANLPVATEEAIREETVQAVEESVQESEPVDAARETSPNLDDVVAKVLARMSPEVLQAVTREILKPVVEAMVRDELSKK